MIKPEIRHDALVAVSSRPDSREVAGPILPVGQLPFELLRYTLPSRYCDSDKLLWTLLGAISIARYSVRIMGQTPHSTTRCPGLIFKR